MTEPNCVYAEPETSYCIFCNGEPKWPEPENNDCFLAGPGHSPLNAEANYVCRGHLDSDAVIESGIDGEMHTFDEKGQEPAARCVCGHKMADHIEGFDPCSLCECQAFTEDHDGRGSDD